jgi:hypothetical protein
LAAPCRLLLGIGATEGLLVINAHKTSKHTSGATEKVGSKRERERAWHQRMTSLSSPVAWPVLDPSKFHFGSLLGSSTGPDNV